MSGEYRVQPVVGHVCTMFLLKVGNCAVDSEKYIKMLLLTLYNIFLLVQFVQDPATFICGSVL